MPRLPDPRAGDRLSFQGRKIPFTFWPDSYIAYGAYCAANPWRCLLTMIGPRSRTDWVKRSRAYIQQSYDFYRASLEASVATKPLMLYYSYLNLTHAFLTYRRRAVSSGKRDRHGLSPGPAPQRYRGLTSIIFRVQKPELNRRDVFAELVQECGFSALGHTTGRSLSAMMYQIPGLHDAFVATSRNHRVFFPVQLEFRQAEDAKQVWVEGRVDVSAYSERDRARLRRFFRSNRQLQRVRGDADTIKFQTRDPVDYARSPRGVLRENLVKPLRRCLWSEQTPRGFQYYLGVNKGFTAQVASNFAIMFTLGMIVRYLPELIAKLESEWLIHEYMATQPLQFAYLLGSGLVRNEIVPNPLIQG